MKIARGWAWVLLGGILEAVYPAILNLSGGLTEFTATVVGFAVSVLATILLNFGLKTGLPMGPSYAVWVGTGVAGLMIIDFVFFGQVFSMISYLFLGMILAGVVGLNLVSGDTPAES